MVRDGEEIGNCRWIEGLILGNGCISVYVNWIDSLCVLGRY